jgi:phospholipase C
MPVNNIVVLMLENRSYDNILGALYLHSTPPDGQCHLDGLTGNETNPDPNDPTQNIQVHSTSSPIQIGGSGPAYAPTCIPMIDTGEEFACMAQQFLSLDAIPTSDPWTGYDPAASGLMQGFTTNYSQLDKAVGQQPPPAQNQQDVMNDLTPEQLPVTAFLAANYAVCDQWFASVPTQTFTNRAFASLAAPAVEKPDFGKAYSYVDDEQYGPKILDARVRLPSIYQQLDAVFSNGERSSANWRVYFHDYPISMLVDTYVWDTALSRSNENVACFDTTDDNERPPFLLHLPQATFVSDVANGTLPRLSFIEPRYSNVTALPPNSAHPGGGNLIPGVASPGNVPMDAASSELLLLQVYNLLQGSPSWNETLLIVTFDEHGGIYDHVPPPAAVAPGGSIPNASNSKDPAANGFDFTVLGGRVPAILISPLIAQGTTIRATNDQGQPLPFDHSSIVRTVWENFGLGSGSLTQRDLNAPSVTDSLTALPTNTTGAFTGTIVCSPTSILFTKSDMQTLYASAGSGTLSASFAPGSSQEWLSFVSSYDDATNMLTVTLTADASGATGLQTTDLQITGDGLDPVTITATLYIA